GRRAPGGVRARRSADRLGAARRRRRAGGPISRLAARASSRCTRHPAPEHPAPEHPAPSTQHAAPAKMRHRLEFLIVRFLIWVVRVMPDAVVRGCGTVLGLMFYLVDGAHRRIAVRNLAT